MDNEIISAAKEGHNFIILGQAGTGKTALVKKIDLILRELGKTVKLTASTGIASSILGGTTVHRFAGIADGRYSDEALVDRILNSDDCISTKTSLLTTDTLIIDEISMLSLKLFLQIEHVCRYVRGKNQPFGGMQVVCSGDFYQLKPVPSIQYDDPGDTIIKHPELKRLMPHHFVLQKVHRQTQGDLVHAVHEVSRGILSIETKLLLQRLSRPLPPGERPIKLFALKYDVEKCNSDHLLDMADNIKLYQSVEKGDTTALSTCAGLQKLYLTVGAPVMLNVNLSDNLVNGLMGKVTETKDECVMVKFAGMSHQTCIKPFMFTSFNPQLNKTVASRRQIPLRLAFALTVHRAQGTTQDRIEVDCRHMNMPGQIGVAIGRVTSKKGLRVLNFQDKLVTDQPSYIIEYYSSQNTDVLPDCSCCKSTSPAKVLMENLFSNVRPEQEAIGIEQVSSDDDDDDDDDDDKMDQATADAVADYDDDAELIQALDQMENTYEAESTYVDLPENVDINEALTQSRYANVKTDPQQKLNTAIDHLLTDSIKTKVFCRYLWTKLCSSFDTCVPDHLRSNKNITQFYGELCQRLISSTEYKEKVATLFQVSTAGPHNYRAAFVLFQYLRKQLISRKAEPLRDDAQQLSMKEGKVFTGSGEGRGKVRYIGGWIVATLRHRKRRTVQRNLYSKKARLFTDKIHKEVQLLDTLVELEDVLLTSSDDKESLENTQKKQNVKHSLCNISDDTFHLFQELDKEVRKLETIESVNVYGKDFYTHIVEKLVQSQSLTALWIKLFGEKSFLEETELIATVHSLWKEVLYKFICMSSAQFRRDFKRTLKITKDEAHRKQIKMRKDKKDSGFQGQNLSTMDFGKDASEGKMASHRLLQSNVESDKFCLEKKMTKEKLIVLCLAYSVAFNSKMTKKVLSNVLSDVIAKSDTMPNSQAVSELSSVQDTSPETQPSPKRTEKAPAVVDKGKRTSDTMPNPQAVIEPLPGPSVKRKKIITNVQDISPETQLAPKRTEKAPGDKKKKIGKQSKGKVICTKRVKWPCGKCEEECKDNSVCCDGCDTWYHYNCVNLQGDESELDSDEWFCEDCKSHMS